MGETFDDFLIIILHNPEKVVFSWTLNRTNLGRHIGYPENTQLATVDKNIFNAVVEEYISNLPKGIIP
jgi:hypothetical protein